jgi:hypothetical protein
MSYYDVPDYRLEPPEDTREVVYHCEICGTEILEGDDFYDIFKLGPCCEECVSDMKSTAEFTIY